MTHDAIRMVLVGALTMACLGPAERARAGDPAFTARPTMVRSEEGYRISFAVSAPIDVEVAVLDGQARVIRHLAAGRLGKNAPEPFKPDALSQEIAWDGKDDAGKPATMADRPVARVRLGLGVQFDRYVRKSDVPPFTGYTVAGLAVDADGNLYAAFTLGTRPPTHLAVFSPQGKYLRTLYPFPATFDPAGVADFKVIPDAEGRFNPLLQHRLAYAQAPGFVALNYMTMDMDKRGRLVMASGCDIHEHKENNWLLMLNRDGTVPRPRLAGPNLGCQRDVHLAFSPDGETVYFTSHDGAVSNVGADPGAVPKVFVGDTKGTGADNEHLNQPRGLAVDAKGNVYVSDFGNQRIQVFNPAGAYVSTLTLNAHPATLRVHPETGVIYVVAWSPSSKTFALQKYAGREGPLLAEIPLGKWSGADKALEKPDSAPLLALDARGKAPVLYLGSSSPWASFCLLRCEDQGQTFSDPAPLADLPPDRKNNRLALFAADPANDKLYLSELSAGPRLTGAKITSCMYSGADNKFSPFWLDKCYDRKLVRGRDGLFYRVKDQHLSRWDETGKPVLFAATGEFSEEVDSGDVFREGERDNLYVTPAGEIYWLYYRSRPGEQACVVVLGPDGKVRRRDLVSGLMAPRNLLLDRRGNLYLADNMKPAKAPFPEPVARVPGLDDIPPGAARPGSYRNVMLASYGSILKFGPEGGSARTLGKGQAAAVGETELSVYLGSPMMAVKGLKGLATGVSFVPPSKKASFIQVCNCYGATSAMDLYDRLFVPDAVQHKVRVLDTNFNEILSFGGYDNFDGPGGEKAAGRPAIPLELPLTVAATDQAVYVSSYPSRFLSEYSLVNNNIVRARLTYAAEARSE
ncbi:MAG: hypothetical protein BIFFINMI_02178 [Phycisphaerae bacterium]|nr:hypothetical protein [Phycisphaerae bacterium]